jgi:hypothetical protein
MLTNTKANSVISVPFYEANVGIHSGLGVIVFKNAIGIEERLVLNELFDKTSSS